MSIVMNGGQESSAPAGDSPRRLSLRQVLAVTGLLVLAVSSFAGGPPRRAVARPASPAPKTITSWTVEVRTSGGFAPNIRTGIVVRSSGEVTLLDYRDQPTCRKSIGDEELSR